MTAHQHLRRLQRPYTIAAWASAVVFGLAGITMMVSNVGRFTGADSDLTTLFIIGGIYLASAIFLLASAVLQLLRIRCPYCQSRLGAQWTRWQHCPFCAASLHTDMRPSEHAKNG